MTSSHPSRIPAPDAFVAAVRRAAQTPPAGVDPWFLGYCGGLRDPAALRQWTRAKQQLVALAGGVQGKVVVDVGSGFGLVSTLMAAWGARAVYSVELHAPMAASHRRLLDRDFHDTRNVLPVRADAGALPIATASADLVLSIEAISHYYDVPRFLDECARVLRPGGQLLVSDGNNGVNPRIRALIEMLWERLENGPPGRLGEHEVPEPMVERRVRVIRERFPQLDPARVRALAEGTSGLTVPEIVARVEAHLAGGPPPECRYRRGVSPREPVWGYVHETLFDPRELAMDLERRGFRARAIPHFGGARNELVRVANDVLRRLPLFRWARGFRMVATRR